MNEDSKTPRHRKTQWGDDERVAVGREKRNAPAMGVPITQFADLEDALPLPPPPDEEITGPQELEQMYGRLSPVEWRFGRYIEDLRKQEAAKAQRDQSTADKLLEAVKQLPGAERFDELAARVLEIEKRTAKFIDRLYKALAFAVGVTGTVLIKAFLVIRAFDAVEAAANNNAARIQLVESYLFLRKDISP